MLHPFKRKWKILVGIVCLLFILNLIADICYLRNWKHIPVEAEIYLRMHTHHYGITTCAEPDEHDVLQPTKPISFCDPMKGEPKFSNMLPDTSSWHGVSSHFDTYGHSCENIMANMMMNNSYILDNIVNSHHKKSKYKPSELISNYEKCINIACKDCPNACYKDWKKNSQKWVGGVKVWYEENYSIKLEDWYRSDSLITCDSESQWKDYHHNRHHHEKKWNTFWFFVIIMKEILKLFACGVYYCNTQLLNIDDVKFLPLIINTPILFVSDLFWHENYSYCQAGRNNSNGKHEFALHCLLYFENHSSKREHFLRIFNVLIDLCLQHIPSFVLILNYVHLVGGINRLIYIENKWIIISMITGVLSMFVHGLILINSLIVLFFVTKEKFKIVDLLKFDHDENDKDDEDDDDDNNSYELKEMSVKHSLLHKNKNKNKQKNTTDSKYITFQTTVL